MQIEPRLSLLLPSVVGRLVAAGYVTPYDINISTGESTNNFCRSQPKPKKGHRELRANTLFKKEGIENCFDVSCCLN